MANGPQEAPAKSPVHILHIGGMICINFIFYIFFAYPAYFLHIVHICCIFVSYILHISCIFFLHIFGYFLHIVHFFFAYCAFFFAYLYLSSFGRPVPGTPVSEVGRATWKLYFPICSVRLVAIWRLKYCVSRFITASDDCDLSRAIDRVRTPPLHSLTVLDPPGATQHGFAVYGALRLFPAWHRGSVVESSSFWRSRPRSRTGPGLAPGRHPCRAFSRASSQPPSPTQGTKFQPSLATLRVPAASLPAAPPWRLRCILDPTIFENLCALVSQW